MRHISSVPGKIANSMIYTGADPRMLLEEIELEVIRKKSWTKQL